MLLEESLAFLGLIFIGIIIIYGSKKEWSIFMNERNSITRMVKYKYGISGVKKMGISIGIAWIVIWIFIFIFESIL